VTSCDRYRGPADDPELRPCPPTGCGGGEGSDQHESDESGSGPNSFQGSALERRLPLRDFV
jgi:hypothetical protein